MVYWVYVIECQDLNVYIGQTKRLYRRFNEHTQGRGSVNTGKYKPKKLIGLYKIGDNYSFLQYRQQIIKNKEYNKFTIKDWGIDEESGKLEIENHITEMYLYLRRRDSWDELRDDYDDSLNDKFTYDDGEWGKIKGGKYTKDTLNNPTAKMNEDDIIDRPCCHCKYPCEIKISKDRNCIYYVCALKNVWDDFFNGLIIEKPCDYYEIYKEDTYIKKQYEINEKKIKESWLQNFPKSQYKIHPEPCIKCNKTEYLPIFAYGCVRRLCQECLSNKDDELSKEYTISKTKCLLLDD